MGKCRGDTCSVYEDEFLEELRRALESRKRLTHAGTVGTERIVESDGYEELHFWFVRAQGPSVAFVFSAAQYCSIYVRSNRAGERGKILFREEHVRLVRNTREVRAAVIEACLAGSYDGTDAVRRRMDPVVLAVV